jgi:U3 small nucleolar RNA-associated protein 19
VASFIKRLSRLTLNASPSAIVSIVPWIYNLFKRHPLCTFMMHREVRDPEAKALMESEGFGDPFQQDESDPMATGAIDSCVWELVQLQSHYHPNVATIAKIISEQFTKHSYNIEDFLDHSYGSVRFLSSPLFFFLSPLRMLTLVSSFWNRRCRRRSRSLLWWSSRYPSGYCCRRTRSRGFQIACW